MFNLSATLLSLLCFSVILLAVGHYYYCKPVHKRCLSLTLSVCLLIGLVGPLYYYFGESAKLAQWEQQQVYAEQAKTFLKKYKTPEQVVARFRQHLAEHPNSAKGWYLIGRLYFSTRHFSEAKQAFGRVLRLEKKNKRAMVQFIYADFYLNHNTLSNDALSKAIKISRQYPDETAVLNVLALDAYANHDYEQAVQYWRRLLHRQTLSEVEKVSIQRAIVRATRKRSLM